MPSGQIHEQLRRRGRWIAFPISAISPFILEPLDLIHSGHYLIGLGIFIGYEIGRYITNDWDCVTMTEDESNMTDEVPILGHYLFGVSSMYGSVMKHSHRKWYTHTPLIATLPRYLIVFFPIWQYIYYSPLDWSWLILIFIGMLFGTSMSDFIHWFADMFMDKDSLIKKYGGNK